MDSECIVRFFNLAYIYLIQDWEEEGYSFENDEVTFQDKKGLWFAKRLFWRFYWCEKV